MIFVVFKWDGVAQVPDEEKIMIIVKGVIEINYFFNCHSRRVKQYYVRLMFGWVLSGFRGRTPASSLSFLGSSARKSSDAIDPVKKFVQHLLRPITSHQKVHILGFYDPGTNEFI